MLNRLIVPARLWVAAFCGSLVIGLGATRANGQPVLGLAATKAPILVLNSLDADVSVIDPVTLKELRRFPAGKQPHHLYLTPDEKSVIVANAGGDSLTFVDPLTGQVQKTVRGIMDPYHLRFSPDMKWFVTAANRLNHVDFYHWDGNDLKLVKRVLTSRTPSHMWIDSKSKVLFVTMQDSDELVAFDLATQTQLWRIGTGKMPADVFVTADDKFLLVGMTGSDGVEVYDVAGKAPRLIKTVKTGAGAHAFRAQGDGKHVYVSNRVANTISRIDLGSFEVKNSFSVPGGPDCMDISADGKLMYVTSRWAKKLSVIDLSTGKLVNQVPVGRSPHGVWLLNHAKRQ